MFNLYSREQWLGIMRHLIGIAGTILIMAGVYEASFVDEIAGGVLAVLSILLSTRAPEKAKGVGLASPTTRRCLAFVALVAVFPLVGCGSAFKDDTATPVLVDLPPIPIPKINAGTAGVVLDVLSASNACGQIQTIYDTVTAKTPETFLSFKQACDLIVAVGSQITL